MLELILTIAVMTCLGALSPGPDCAIVIQHTIIGKRPIGMAAVTGIACAMMLHLSYITMGMRILEPYINEITAIIQCLGGLYLIYIGLVALKKFHKTKINIDRTSTPKIKHVDPSLRHQLQRKAFMDGFWTNLLNPKVIYFLLAIFSLLSSHHLSLVTHIWIAVMVWIIVTCTMFLLCLMLSNHIIYRYFLSLQLPIMMIMSLGFILVGSTLFLGQIISWITPLAPTIIL